MTRPLVLVLGATSDIGRAIARTFAAQGCDIALAARQLDRLADDAADLRLRHGVEATVHHYDALSGDDVLSGLPRLPETVVCCVGDLPAEPMSAEPEAIRHALRVNAEGPILALAQCADSFAARGHGTIIAIASVAGLRGRASNGLYGAGKAALIAWLSAARNRAFGSGVRVITVLPGFVDTRMTAGLALPSALTATPEEVARLVLRAAKGRRDIVYVRPIWRWIMAVITHLPERLFRRLKI